MTHPTTPKMIPVELLEKWIAERLAQCDSTVAPDEYGCGQYDLLKLLEVKLKLGHLSPDRERGGVA